MSVIKVRERVGPGKSSSIRISWLRYSKTLLAAIAIFEPRSFDRISAYALAVKHEALVAELS